MINASKDWVRKWDHCWFQDWDWLC